MALSDGLYRLDVLIVVMLVALLIVTREHAPSLRPPLMLISFTDTLLIVVMPSHPEW